MYKKYSVVRTSSEEILEEFSTMESAEAFMIMMQKKGESVKIKTNKEDSSDEDSFEIEGLDVEEPTIEFGSDLGMFDEDDSSSIEFE